MRRKSNVRMRINGEKEQCYTKPSPKKQKPAMQGLEADVEKRNGEHTALHKAANLS
jgi:hypothetical protein